MKTGTVIAVQKKRVGQQAQFQQQRKTRRAQRADGGIHAVNHQAHASRLQEATAGHKVVRPPQRGWRRATDLPTVPDRGGFSYRWVSIDRRNIGDGRGISRRQQEGWVIVRPGELPEDSLPTNSSSRYGQIIGNGEMVLMKMSTEYLAQRNEYFNEKRDAVTASIETEHEQYSDERMPIRRKATSRPEFIKLRKKRKVGSGRSKVADDDDV